MTQQPFSRPGAIDLSGLGRPPAPQQAAPSAGAGSAGGAYSVAITQDNFQQVLQESMTAPVVIVFHSAAQAEEEAVDPRYAPAEDALAAGDIDAAVAEYQKLLDANPADVEAADGLAIAKVMQRTQGVDLNAARAAAAGAPDDVDAQTLVADLDMLGGHVEDAFTRLVNLVARTSDKEREKARDHLLGLFAAVGNDDPRVLAGRRNLASALF